MGAVNDVYSKWGSEDETWTDLDPEDRTLKHCLEKFHFGHLLKDLDENLENVRKHKYTEDSHREMIKEYDKELKKLSLSYHPDCCSGGSADDREETKSSQAALNSIRSLLNHLSEEFLRDIDIDYRYEYYAKVDISAIGNEEDVDKLNLNLQHQLIMLSEIKHEKIIANIKKFLISSEQSLDSYFKSDTRNFTCCLNQSLGRLDECIEGYETLMKEFGQVRKECAKDFKLQTSLWVVKRMSNEFERQLKNLKTLRDIAKQSLKGQFLIYADNENVDSYFVLPFVKYLNVLLMCNVVLVHTGQNLSTIAVLKSEYHNRNSGIYPIFNQLDYNDRKRKYYNAYYFALYLFNPSSYNKYIVRLLLKDQLYHRGNLLNVCFNNFNDIVKNISHDLKAEFKPEEHYIVRSLKIRTQEYDKEVKEFFETVMKRKKYNTFDVLSANAKNGNAADGKITFQNQAFKYPGERSFNNTRNFKLKEDFEEGEERILLESLRDRCKDMSENLKMKIIENEIRNEKLREAFEIHKMDETVLLEKLSIVNEKRGAKLTREIIQSDEEVRKLKDELEIKREEEKLLILKLSGRYEEIGSKLQAEINETEKRESTQTKSKNREQEVMLETEKVNELPGKFKTEGENLEILETEVENQENTKEISENDVKDQNSVQTTEIQSPCSEISGEATENLQLGHGFQRDSRKDVISEPEIQKQTIIQGFGREGSELEISGNEGNQKAVRVFEIPVKIVKTSESETDNRESLEVEKESRILEISRNETNSGESLHEYQNIMLGNNSENELKNQKLVNDFRRESREVKISVNGVDNKVDEFECASAIKTVKKISVEEFEKQREEDKKLLGELRSFRKEMKAKVNTEITAKKC